jgi:type IV pilus assembly protein PilV
MFNPSHARARAGRPIPLYAAARGFTLVEILVTILVISIGLLGIAGLHSFSLRNNYDALMRSHASALAADIADRMRSNRDNVYLEAGESEYVIELGASPEVDDESSRALVDVSEWKDTLAAQLPDGDGSIAVDQATRTVTIVVRWGERGQDMTFTTETEV